MDTPVILDKAREVGAIRVGNKEGLSGLAATQRDREEQVIIIDPAVASAIEVRKVFDHFNAACLKYPQIKICIYALDLAAKGEGVIALDRCERVTELQAPLFGTLWHAERCAVLDAGKRKLRPGIDRLNVVEESAETKVKTIHVARIQYARVVREERMGVVGARLSLRSGTDGSIQSARRYVVFALQRIPKEQVIL